MRLTKETLAAKLSGREYRSEITKVEEAAAKKAGLVVVYGYSDDNVEFTGAIEDEVGAYSGTTLLVSGNKVLPDHDECECEYCGYKALAKSAKSIKAVWDDDDDPKSNFTWTFRTQIPHATFEIMEGEEQFCRGIVFALEDVK